MIISKIPMEMPAFVAISKPISFKRSKDSMVSDFPRSLNVSRIKFPRSPLRAGALKKPSSGGQIVLKRTRPTVVRITDFFARPNWVSFPLSGFARSIQSCRFRTPSCMALSASSRDAIRGSLLFSLGISPCGSIVKK